MKKIMLVHVILITSFTKAAAQKISQAAVPPNVVKAFASAYPQQKVKWEKENSNYEAGFKMNGSNMSVLYSADGILMEIEKDIAATYLPENVRAYIKKNMPYKKIREAAIITTAAGVITYEAEIAGKDMLFNDRGIFIKTQLNNK